MTHYIKERDCALVDGHKGKCYTIFEIILGMMAVLVCIGFCLQVAQFIFNLFF